MENIEIIEFGKKIKVLLELKNLKRCYLAEKLNITYNTLTKKINGQREFTYLEILKMKSVLDVDKQTFADLLFNEKFLLK